MNLPSVLFVLPSSGASGGANSIVQETIGLRKLGVRVTLAVDRKNASTFRYNYPELRRLEIPLKEYDEPRELADHLPSADVIVATKNVTVFEIEEALRYVREPKGAMRVAYYVQDYEPLFYPADSDGWIRARKSYTAIKDAALFAKTDWLRNIIYENHGLKVAKVSPSIDHEIYFPKLNDAVPPFTVTAMLRPSTPRRAPWRTLRVLKSLSSNLQSARLRVFGAAAEDIADFGMHVPEAVQNLGVLRRFEVPDVLRGSTIFLDLSDYQAFGRTALEAMACGCIPVVPLLGGTAEYAKHGHNAFAVDTRCDAAILNAVMLYTQMSERARSEMRLDALATAANFTVHKAAVSELKFFCSIIEDV
jgi:glycosyltransferase involved in cell wall biosynthesis